MPKNKVIIVEEQPITILDVGGQDYISLTDMIKSFGDDTVIYNWLRNRSTIEFLGIWEEIHNPNFKPSEFDRFKNEAGMNTFILSPKNGLKAPVPLE